MRNLYSTRGSFINFILVFISLLILYQYRYGLGMLNPVNDAWLMKHDWATHYLGWFFYRNEPWGFPLGNIANYLSPVGTNVGFTDSIPLAAIFFKIFSPLLPEPFQYLGWWLFLCHVLLTFFVIKLFDLFSVRGLIQLVATWIVVLNPVLLYRSMHPSLCSHWLIVGSLWVYFLDIQKYSPTRLLTYQGIFLLIAGLINPYFSLVEAGFLVALAWRLWQFDHRLSFLRSVAFTGTTFVALVVGWYIVGFFGFTHQGDLGINGAYGLYAFNLNSFHNSGGWSTFFPRAYPYVSWHQYEGFMYLGVGMMALLALVSILLIIQFIKGKIKPPATETKPVNTKISILPLVAFVIVISLFAITNVITWNDKILFTIPLDHKLQKLADIFRASGRYMWVLYYIIFLVAILFTIRLVRIAAIAVIVLMATLVIQLYDYRPMLGRFVPSYEPYHPPILEAQWRTLFNKLDRITFYPPFEATQLTDADYRYFCYLAADYRKPINLGYSARNDYKAMADYTDDLKRNIDLGHLDGNALYITTSKFVGRFQVPYQAGLIGCGQLDGYFYFYPKRMQNDPAIAELSKEVPVILTERRTFKPFSLNPGDSEMEPPVGIERLERSINNIFLEGWFLKGNAADIDDLAILLKSDNNELFISPAARQQKDSIHVLQNLDTTRFNGTYFTEGLKRGNYEIGAYYNFATGKNKKGSYVYFGNVNVGYPDLFNPKELKDFPKIQCWIEVFDDMKDKVKVSGWAFIQGHSSLTTRTEILLRSGNKIYSCPTDPIIRPDVTGYFNSPVNLGTSGFVSTIVKKGLGKGEYEIGIRVVDEKSHQEAVEYMGRVFEIKE